MKSELPILYSFRRCPYAIRARLAIAYAGISVELREVVLKDKPEHMLKLSPKATVPVLYLAAMNTVIDESIDIMHWALSQNDPDQWYLENGSARDANDELIHQNDEEFKPWLDKYKYADRHPEQTQESYRDCAERFLLKLEALLNKNDYLFGDKVSLADMAIFPFIRQFAFVDKAWFDQSDYQKLIAWLQKLLDSNLFNRVMNKYPRWQTGDADTLFPPE